MRPFGLFRTRLPFLVAVIFMRLGFAIAADWREDLRLFSPDGTDPGDFFGRSLKLSRDYLSVGAPRAQGVSTNSGAIFLFSRVTGEWVYDGKVFASPEDPLTVLFGYEQDICGQTVVASVGYYSDASANGRVWEYSREAAGWALDERLLSPLTDRITYFGESVGCGGDLLVVGAPGQFPPTGGYSRVGALHVYMRQEGEWLLDETIFGEPDREGQGRLGSTVALSGDLIASGDSSFAAPPFGHSLPEGVVRLYRLLPSGWSPEAAFLARDFLKPEETGFGDEIALSGDTLVVGQWVADDNLGAAHVFRRKNGEWALEAKLVAPDRQEGQGFGGEVSVHGDRIAIGALHDSEGPSESGAVYVFRRGGSRWQMEAKLRPTDAEQWGEFGTSVAIRERTLAVGAFPGVYLLSDKEVPPLPGAGAPEEWLIPAAARATGLGGERWVSDLVLHNPGSELRTVWLHHLAGERGVEGTAEGWRVDLDPGATERLDDVLGRKFRADPGRGAILVESEGEVVATSKTFDDRTAGGLGQRIPAIPKDELIGPGEEVVLPRFEISADRRTTIGISNGTGDPVEVTVELLTEAGLSIDEKVWSLGAWEARQESIRIPELPIGSGWARVRASGGSGRFAPWMSTIDSRHGDPFWIGPVRASADPRWIAVASNAPGQGESRWASDLVLVNPGRETARVRLSFLPEGEGVRSSSSVAVGGGAALTLGDVVERTFGAAGSGGIEIVPEVGAIAAWSRIRNDGQGTAEAISAVGADEAIDPDHEGRIVGLSHSPDAERGFRTNLGWLNPDESPLELRVELRAGDGRSLEMRQFVLPGRSIGRWNGVFSDCSESIFDDALAVVRTPTLGARLFAWGAIVDNRSGDVVWVPAERSRSGAGESGERARGLAGTGSMRDAH